MSFISRGCLFNFEKCALEVLCPPPKFEILPSAVLFSSVSNRFLTTRLKLDTRFVLPNEIFAKRCTRFLGVKCPSMGDFLQKFLSRMCFSTRCYPHRRMNTCDYDENTSEGCCHAPKRDDTSFQAQKHSPSQRLCYRKNGF